MEKIQGLITLPIIGFVNSKSEPSDPDYIELFYEDGKFKFYETSAHQKIQEVWPVFKNI